MLLFTYRFSFPWFHNDVLSSIRRNISQNAEILVIASRFEDDAFPGFSRDLYSLDEWAKWRGRLRIHYLPTDRHIFHNKFVLVQFENRKKILGLGSANLSSSGWTRNLETWTWDGLDAIPSCLQFLKYLSSRSEGEINLLEPWIKNMSAMKSDSNSLDWLFGDKGRKRVEAFRSLTRSVKGSPKVLRIVSPYFDKRSPELMKELLKEIEAQRGKIKLVEIWVDGSGKIATRSDYENILRLLDLKGTKIEVKALRKKGVNGGPILFEALHAKLIEVEYENGIVRRILGSANFTGAAWLSKRNTETIFLEPSKNNLFSHLGEQWEAVSLDSRKIRKLISAAEKSEGETDSNRRWIYWATFDESEDFPLLTISYKASDRPVDVTVEADFEPIHREEHPEKTRGIILAYTEARNWDKPIFEGTFLLRRRFLKQGVPFPEKLRVYLRFSDGTTIDAPVEVSNPNFELRDPTSGIPLEPSIENLVGPKLTIVRPLSKKSTQDVSDDNEPGEEEEVVDPPTTPDSLADDPEFSREPLAVKFAKILNKLKADPEKLQLMKKKLSYFHSKIKDPKELILAEALSQILKRSPK